MPTSLIVGSGPAAAGAALALTQHRGQLVTVLTSARNWRPTNGGSSMPWRRLTVASGAVPRWPRSASSRWGPIAVHCPRRGPMVPISLSATLGNSSGVDSEGRANRLVVSSAYGGFSNVWGAQTMPWSAPTFDQWPIKWSEMEPHYRSVLEEVPLTGVDDDLSELFPLLADAQDPPKLAERSRRVLDRYSARRAAMRAQGITVGVARLALDARSCVRCGLCMTGCPYSLIYSASHTFDRLRAAGRISYLPGLLAYRIGERAGRPFAEFRDLATGGTRASRG